MLRSRITSGKAGCIGAVTTAELLGGGRFADDRIICRFHLEGVGTGQRVVVLKIDSGSGERLSLLGTATVGEGGWVDLRETILVRAGDTFIAVREQTG